MSDIEEKERDDEYEGLSGTNVLVPPTGEVDNHLGHQLQDANKNITKEMMHDNSNSSYFYSNTTTSTSSMLQNTKMSRNDYENVYYQKGKQFSTIKFNRMKITKICVFLDLVGEL